MLNPIICLDEVQRVKHLTKPLVVKTIQEVKLETQIALPHRHNFYTIIWVQHSEGKHMVDFEHYDIQDNTIYFLSQEQIYYLKMQPNPQGFVIMFNDDFLIQSGLYIEFVHRLSCFDKPDLKFLKIGEDTAKLFHQLVRAMQRETQKIDEFTAEITGALLKLFCLGCKRIYQQQDNEMMTLLSENRALSIVKEFKTLVNIHYATKHKVGDYAEMMDLTAAYLNQTIKQEANFTPKDYIVQRIMLEAKKKALFSEAPAKEVANSLGFDDPAHFSKLFKNTENINFSNFRETYLDMLKSL